jgi:DNA-binding NtrC family response regulator
MWVLSAREGMPGGGRWTVSEKPLLVGRDFDCDVVVPSPLVSRRHCRIVDENGVVQLEDLGSRNATLHNGRPVTRATLYPGDTVAIGTALFELVEGEVSVSAPGEEPATWEIARSVYVSGAWSAAALSDSPRTAVELFHLYQLARALSDAHDARAVAARTYAAIRDLLEPGAAWFAIYRAQDDALVLLDDDPPPAESAPEAAMRRAITGGQAVIQPKCTRGDGGTVLETLLAVPLEHGGETLGALALLGRSPGRVYQPEEAQCAMGIAALVAPHLRAARHLEQLERDSARDREALGRASTLLGDSPAMGALREAIARIAPSRLPVLLTGETGTGKELTARMIHDLGPRAGQPYVVVNCAAIPNELFESEMFGHERGAFTGATAARVGRLEEAHGGTLFLDEVGDLSAENQAKLLRVIESGVFQRVGGNRDYRADLRIIAATNRALEAPAFRTDLYHRLNGVHLDLPPLRSRPGDIAALARHFLHAATRDGVHPARDFSPEALACLASRPWPGNVRELKSAVERAALFCDGPVIELAHLGFRDPAAPGEAPADPSASPPPLAEVERRHIQAVVHWCDGNLSAAARLLGINRTTLYKKLHGYSE